MTVNTGKHIVVFPVQMWGHSRTMCTLVARLVKLRNVTVTFFTVNSWYDRIKAEIDRDFLPDEEHFASRIRLISLKESEVFHDISGSEKSFEAAWVKLLNDEPLTCEKTGAEFQVHPVRPSAAILDLFVTDAFEVIRKLSPGLKIYSWLPAATHTVFMMLGRDPEKFAKKEAARRGVPFEEVVLELLMKPSGKVVETPCNPPMYDYEVHPQAFQLPASFVAHTLIKIGGLMDRTDGVITFDAAEYLPAATEALRAWMAQTSRKVYYAGPLIPRTQEDTSKDPRSEKIQKFLDEKLASHGEKSLIYISFGSLFWPTDPAKLWAVIEVIVDKNIPFVMSGAAAFASQTPAEMQEKIAKYGNGIMTEWVPQQALLDHPVTGWYLSHGGHNSTLESIMAGIPTIVWPIDADQPMNAIHLSETFDVAYELIEVRNGTGAGKIYRNGRTPIATVDAVKDEMRSVLERAFGEDGARKRAKLQGVRKTLQAAWAEDGIGRREVEAFLDDL